MQFTVQGIEIGCCYLFWGVGTKVSPATEMMNHHYEAGYGKVAGEKKPDTPLRPLQVMGPPLVLPLATVKWLYNESVCAVFERLVTFVVTI